MLITVSGLAGSGKSTLAGALADALDCDHVSGGDLFREVAAERDLTPLELNKRAEADDSIDLELDRRLRATARDRDHAVVESRLAGWMAADHADLKIWLQASESVRVDRIAEREDKSVATAREETRARTESEAQRYADLYDIDIQDLSIYDLTINTARWGPAATTDLAVAAVEAYDADADEGRTPIEDVTIATRLDA
ncbi:(d)CMP kinase [Halococcoides cellulosivorans]|uniref:Cytidylate kinase n=1 Tax=Halococcoides cellulosivorans TaxID=1679096 RepID=A0A2R4WZE4_9EURY|nr:AAA family ATPase [Halococcoides cellulosivorans]AWB26913.1 cytidylate kinase [Halococcoides cellulosivorans]